MASLDDILTTQKNGVVAINGLTQTLQKGQGTVTSSTVSTDTLVVTGKGYLVNFSVVASGTANGTISNSQTVAGVASTNALCAVPQTIGVYSANLVFTTGLVIKPGTGQQINVTYSLG